MKKAFLVLLILFISCENHMGNQIYFQSQYEAIDVGSSFGSTIYVGGKNNPNVFKEILVWSDVLSYYKSDEKLYVKQEFNDSIFLNVCADHMAYRKEFTSPYLTDEINQIISETEDSLTTITRIRHSDFYTKMDKNKINYYIIDIPNRKVEGVYNLENFKEKIDEKTILSELEK